MGTNEKPKMGRPVGSKNRDPFAEAVDTMAKIADLQQDIRICRNTVEQLMEQSLYIHAGFERLNLAKNMDDAAKLIATKAGKRLYFAQHFFPEYMKSELSYMCEELTKLQAYLEIHLPQEKKENL